MTQTKKKIFTDTFSNFVGVGASALVPLLTIPYLVNAFGPTRWGLVSFSVLMISILSLLNSGIAQALVKEFGQRLHGAADGSDQFKKLFAAYERAYLIFALTVSTTLLVLASPLSKILIRSESADPSEAVLTIHAVAFIFSIQLPSVIYRAAASSGQWFYHLNLVRFVAAISKGVFSVLTVWFTGSLLAYFIAIFLISVIETLMMRKVVMVNFGSIGIFNKVDWGPMLSSLPFTSAMCGLAILGIITSQIDKILVSSILSVEALGIYTIAFSISMGVLQLTHPIFITLLPYLVRQKTEVQSSHSNDSILILIGACLIFILLFPVYLKFGPTVLSIWLGDEALAKNVSEPLKILLIAVFLNVIYNIGYTNWLAQGHIRPILFVGVLGLIGSLTIAPFFITKFSLSGAAFAYLSINIVGSLTTLNWLIRRKTTK